MIRLDTEVSAIKKGTILLKERELPLDNYFIIQGCIRQYYLKDGEEKTSMLFTEEEWILPFTSIDSDGKSTCYLECTEDCQIVVANDKEGNEFLEAFPEFYKISQLILEKEIIRQQTEFAKYVKQSPEERYIDLLKYRPNLINRVPQYHIASYIGVKPESLSRIRKRIASKPWSNFPNQLLITEIITLPVLCPFSTYLCASTISFKL